MAIVSIKVRKSKIDEEQVSVKPAAESTDWCSLNWPGLEGLAADCGFFQGVSEFSGAFGRGGVTQLALRLTAAIHRAQSDAWCVWFSIDEMLHAPGAAQIGVDLRRFIVVQSPDDLLAKWVLRTTARGLFDGLVVDAQSALNLQAAFTPDQLLDAHWLKRLALASEKTRTRVVLLTDAAQEQTSAWPVDQKLKCEQFEPDAFVVEVTKSRRGTVSPPRRIKLVSGHTHWKRGDFP